MAERTRFIIVGLGNVGKQYQSSRHNIGFDVVDTLARNHNLQFFPGKGDFFQALERVPAGTETGTVTGKETGKETGAEPSPRSGFLARLKSLFAGKLRADTEKYGQGGPADFPGILLKPTTLMNRSGIAIRQALDIFSIEPQQVIVVVDDFHLPLGRLRLRKRGSDGGHNGLKSIITELGCDAFPRLRVGIGPKPDNSEIIEFVLGQFSESETRLRSFAVKRAACACEELLFSSSENPLDIIAAKYNTVPSDPAPGSDID